MPGTQVKKVKKNHNLGGDQPWQSVVAAKVGFGFGLDGDISKAKVDESRDSLLAVYLCKSMSDTDSEVEESQSYRKEARYKGMGAWEASWWHFFQHEVVDSPEQ